MAKFETGNWVRKVKGYSFEGRVVSVFSKVSGETRLVVENRDGMLHIYNEDQLEITDDPWSRLTGPYDIKAELEFALARIKDWEGEEDQRDWFGHVEPSLSRLREML